ncbi:hypothetical protein [Clostridium sp. chh4-2]|nr:hypothetical protein [Clostridium sp. chh4-2]
MRDLYQCDACGCTDDDVCRECRRQSQIRKEHARERDEGGYDERDNV